MEIDGRAVPLDEGHEAPLGIARAKADPRDRGALGRNLLAGWMGRIGFHLERLADRVLQHVRAGERLFADPTIPRPT